MNEVNLKKVQAAQNELPEQIFMLQDMLVKMEETGFILNQMSYMEESVSYIKQAMQEITEEIEILLQMQVCMEEVLQLYRETEQRIADTYDLERISYPRTEFGRNRTESMAAYRYLFFWKE